EPACAIRPARHFEWYFCLGERALRPYDALRDRRLCCEKRARDLVRRQPADQSQRQRNARFRREHRMAGREHETQQVVTDVLVESSIEVWGLLLVHLAPDLLVLALDQPGAPPCIERAVLRRGHEPGARIVGNAPFGPSLERCDESILRELLRSADVAREAREA